ncbi:hypothetical protein [Aestuariicoccus sp. MJ-SS9]|uniref:hypothetical protein n=1 Tax=Aestuariicoccus sp. MJ-SS9 TaxID=3079855 RepID=UPI00290CBA6F|nr:hypothetical protein [Aestuariicoccus sp. MJ-SS9]MDU8910478.1 hypothetical protein [Aestuariicoccus sp. MJ-SS9]
MPSRAGNVRPDFARILLLRLCLSTAGWALGFSAFLWWLAPGPGALPELSLPRLGLSLAMLLGGLCCLVAAHPSRG